MNPSLGHRFWRCAIVLAFVATVVPSAVSSQGTPTSDDVAVELPTLTPFPELPSPTPEPLIMAPTDTPEAPTALPTESLPSDTQTPTPADSPTETPSATATATATPTPVDLTIRVESAELSFGRIDASGTLDNSASAGLLSEPLEDGASFVVPAAVVIEVDGSGPWDVTCAAMGENDVSLDMIQAGRLEWRIAGEGDWNAFASPQAGPICLREPAGGPRQFVLDVRLYVASTDPPGRFAATLEFSVIGQS